MVNSGHRLRVVDEDHKLCVVDTDSVVELGHMHRLHAVDDSQGRNVWLM